MQCVKVEQLALGQHRTKAQTFQGENPAIIDWVQPDCCRPLKKKYLLYCTLQMKQFSPRESNFSHFKLLKQSHQCD